MAKKHVDYATKGVCASSIHFDIEDGKLGGVRFINGCPGNLLAISKLAEGADAAEFAARVEGLPCGRKNTSCADQFSKAIKEALRE